MSRKPSENDKQIYKEIKNLMHHEHFTYSQAVQRIAHIRGLKVSAVYGMANRAKSAPVQSDFVENVKGTTTLYNADGSVKLQWVKTVNGKDSWDARIWSALETVKQFTPYPPVKHLENPANKFLTVYPVADLHIGLYASFLETGEDWNLEKALQRYRLSFNRLFYKNERNGHALIANLGDFTHIDNDTNRTPKSGVALDTSHRYRDIVNGAVDLAMHIIDQAIEAHEQVTVIWQSGNHDEATAIVMQAALKQLYRYHENVHIVEPSSRFYVHQHHKVALGFTHGDTVKPEQLPLLMASDHPVIWGDTEHRVWHTGHVHHRSLQEYPGCVVETHGAPVPKDAWHHREGYRSNRIIQSITYDAYGETERKMVRV